MSTAYSAEFEESGAFLDLRLRQLDQAIIELDERLKALEAGEPIPPPDPPLPPDPPIEPEPVTPTVLAVEPGQDPFSQHHTVEGDWIEAEDFDVCDLAFAPDCAAYFDTTPENIGGMYRSTAVDIKATGDVGGGYQVGWNVGRLPIDREQPETRKGDWVEYTIGVAAGVYDFEARVTKNTTSEGGFDVLLGGRLLGRVEVPNTGSWDANYVTVTLPCLLLEAGNKILRLEMFGGPVDINKVRFVKGGTPENDPPCDIVLVEP
jgi:hypothetical protein